MNLKEYRREEEEQSYYYDLKAEKNTREREVYLTFKVIVETHQNDLAIEEAFNILKENDLNDYLHKEEVL